MGIKMNTYTGNQMTAEYDGIIQHRAIPESGILYGCEISYMGSNQVHIEKGYIMIMGRFCTVTEETLKVAMSSSSTEIPGRLYIHADLSDAQNPVKFMSVASNPLPVLVKDENFNYTNGVYDLELATYTAGMTTIKNLVSTCSEIVGGTSMIGDNFSEQESYDVGDYTIRKNTLYRFKTAHPAGSWNEAHVIATTVAAELAAQNKNFDVVNISEIAVTFNSKTSRYGGHLYKQGKHITGTLYAAASSNLTALTITKSTVVDGLSIAGASIYFCEVASVSGNPFNLGVCETFSVNS